VLSPIPAQQPSMLRQIHEEVPLPPPLSDSSAPPTDAHLSPSSASVHKPIQQQYWITTLDKMMLEPDADINSLNTIRSHIIDGITLPLISLPQPVVHNNTSSVQEHAQAVRSRLKEYMDFGAVIRLPSGVDLNHESVQPLHVIIKPDRKPRIVIDLSRNLNQYLQYTYFTYTNVDTAVSLSSPGCWYGKLDLSNCFLSFPLHPSIHRYFIFAFEGDYYQFIRMPFGLSTAPLVCTQLLSVIAYALTALDIIHVRYLDDFLIISHDQLLLQQQLLIAQTEITRFGLVINHDKTEGPDQRITFLGIQLDSVSCTLSCPATRITELLALLESLRHQRIITRQSVESLIGKLSFAAIVLPGARPFLRRMLDTLNACSSRQRTAPVRIDKGFRRDVDFWLLHLTDWNGSQVWRSSRSSPFTFATDASLSGFGFYLESCPPSSTIDTSAWPPSLRVGAGFSGSYSAKQAADHLSHTQIAWCELLAVLAAAITYAPYLKNQSLLFLVDNSTDVHIINRQATRSKTLAAILRQLFSVSLYYNLHIFAQHRPGVTNILADFLSRPDLHQHDPVAVWQSTHPDDMARLSSVSLVVSDSFIGWSPSSPLIQSA
jgi:hypothetical protein